MLRRETSKHIRVRFSYSSPLFCSFVLLPSTPIDPRTRSLWDFISFSSMAARIIAQLLVVGSGVLVRAFTQAYRQALANACKTGAAQEAMQNTVRRASRAITEQEARQILGVTENSAWEEILKKYDVLFESNAKQGSFYLQSKVHRAKECLEPLYQNKGQSSAN